MSGITGLGAIAGVQANSNIDVEMFMMQISAQRASNLESQMKDQVNEVKARQDAIGKLTQLVNTLTSLIKGAQSGAEITLPQQTLRPDLGKNDWVTVLEDAGLSVQSDDEKAPNYLKANYAYTSGGCVPAPLPGRQSMPGGYTSTPGDAPTIPRDDIGAARQATVQESIVGPTKTLIGMSAKKETLEGWIDGLKGSIDGLNSQGQLDMIRLQSVMNKRNEAFEQMTNTMQKFSKARESIVGNLR